MYSSTVELKRVENVFKGTFKEEVMSMKSSGMTRRLRSFQVQSQFMAVGHDSQRGVTPAEVINPSQVVLHVHEDRHDVSPNTAGLLQQQRQ